MTRSCLLALALTSGCVLTDPLGESTATAADDGTDDGPSVTESVDDDGTSAGVDSSDTSGADSTTWPDPTVDTTDTEGNGLPSATAIDLAVGRLHSCALVDDGSVRCWGYADHGQLGNGAPLDDAAFRVPVEVVGLSGVTAISSRFDHTCALAADGGVLCWGANGNGQLGDGTTADSALPVAVAGLAGIVAIDTGVDHSCAIDDAGGVWCWGKNDYGQLGDGTIDDASAPVSVAGISSGAVAIAAGRWHTCAVTDAGAVACWGGDTYGELGDGEPLAASPTPVTILDAGVVDVAAGDSTTCVITDVGAARCWGKNDDGQLGNGESGTLVESHVPTDVVGLASGVTSISPGYGYTCAVADGAAKCWGDNLELTLGNGEGPGFQSAVPVDVVGLARGTATIGGCSTHTCARTLDGAVKCWGGNDGGELGDGTDASSAVPVDVVSLP